MNDTERRREFLESLGIKTDGFRGMEGEWEHIRSVIRGNKRKRTVDMVLQETREMLAACFFCIRKQQEQIAELKERLK